MTKDEYVKLFHKVQLNLVAFKPLFHCDDEVLKLVNAAIEAERKACAKVCDDKANEHNWEGGYAHECSEAIRSRSNT